MGGGTSNVTIIGAGAKFKGELVLEGAAQIQGTFDGVIEAAGEVTVANGALCKATVQADRVVVDGQVQGDLLARERLQLTDKANVQGDITAASLVVAEGATFIGRCAVGSAAVQAAAKERAALAAEPKPRTRDWEAPVAAREFTSNGVGN